MLKFHLTRAQNCMKQVADRKRSKWSLFVGDSIFLKLHLYSQHTERKTGAYKLQPRWFSPFTVLKNTDLIAYKLDLPATTFIHSIMHVSQLKLAHGEAIQYTLLSVGVVRPFPCFPKYLLERKMVWHCNRAASKILVKWKDLTKGEATWEFLEDF